MKKSILSVSMAVAVIGVGMLNFNVVFNRQSQPYVKPEALIGALANESSSSGGDDPSAAYAQEWSDDPTNTSGYTDAQGYVPPGKKRKMKHVFNGVTKSTGNPVVRLNQNERMRGSGTWKISLGGKMADNDVTTSSSSSQGSSSSVILSIEFTFGQSHDVTYDSHDCDQQISNPCDKYNQFKSMS